MAIIDRRDQLALGASTISAALGANPVTQFSPAETFFSDPDEMKDGSTEFTYTKLLKKLPKTTKCHEWFLVRLSQSGTLLVALDQILQPLPFSFPFT